ncbi:bifunctional hydroxy-methylpyrimidine kinase/ hydroxy-phosphomethylpyrimidine kinase [Haemophilus influenzae]|uniref:hydroxymethylpyrimidine kinase n=2 Tax=Bacteria TaxID=2 RepID=A0A2X1PJD3_HAEIF|nr:bifunctional hydroxy-methylpyrimidine kinase/ hydroxy-phosphomethylpyrimidine kinase [Haemophilus influenzae]
MSNVKQVLTIAGSDSGGGAGIQADLKTFQMRGVFGTSAITAVTAQNTLGVFDIHPIPLKTIQAQLEAVKNDFQIASCKIGMLGNAEIIECVADFLADKPFGTLVLDPVMIAQRWCTLIATASGECVKPKIAAVGGRDYTEHSRSGSINGNCDCGRHQYSTSRKKRCKKQGAKNVIIKGGHSLNSQSELCQDWVLLADGRHFTLQSPRFNTPHTHGTGCTFSACLTAELAKGEPLQSAVKTAKDFITAAISHSLNIGQGHGPTNHWAYSRL